MPRLFTGLEVPDALGQSLSFLRGGLSGAKWIDPENYHVTLRFIGDVDDRTAFEIAAELARLRRRRFEVRIEGVMAFGGKQPHSLVAKVTPSAALIELQGDHERICQRLGLAPEPRRFMPHVTVARCKNLSHGAVAQWLALRGGFFGSAFEVERFVLYSSKASRGGGPYVLEDTWPLAAAAPGDVVPGQARVSPRAAPIAARFHPRFAPAG